MPRFRTLLMTLVVVPLSLTATVRAASAQARVGVRAGDSVDPNQFYFGGHVETPVADRLRFRPNVEISVGNSVTLTAFNLEFIYPFTTAGHRWHVYAGGGPALNWYRSTGVSNTKGGLNLLLGLEHRDGLFFEGKVGVIDSPDLKFGVGYTFR